MLFYRRCFLPDSVCRGKILAEPNSGKPLQHSNNGTKFQLAICGSYIATENELFYNRAFFLTPEGEEFYYDKRHLFRMGREAEHFSAGDKRLIIPYHGWNICLQVCYDLRFPVWSRNVGNEYDFLIYVANWLLSPRRLVWDTLLRARALENQCYVCGVNRVGTDGYQLSYNGGSKVYSAFGEEIGSIPDEKEGHNDGQCKSHCSQPIQREVPGMERCRRISSVTFTK